MAYGYYASITIDNTKVSGTSNLTNFPILVKGTYDGTGGEPDIRTTANGGNVQNTDSGGASGSLTVPADLVFSPNTDGSSPYDFEIEYYNASTGEIIAHVEIPTLDYNDDTVLYMVYGDSGVTTSQEDVGGTWKTGLIGVWHLNEDPTGTVYDSTSNGNNMAGVNMVSGDLVNSAGGFGDNYLNFSDTDDALKIGAASAGDFDVAGPFSVETVVYPNSVSNAGRFTAYDSSSVSQNWVFQLNNTTPGYLRTTTDNGIYAQTSTLTATTGSWQYIGVFMDSSNSNFFIDDNTKESVAETDPSSQTADFYIGNLESLNKALDARVDEVRVWNIAITDDWRLTTYNTLMDSSNFYTMGSETGGGGSTTTTTSTSTSTSSSTSSSSTSSSSTTTEQLLDYSRGDEAALPANDSDLENLFTQTEYDNVETDDNVRVAQTATDEYAIFLFKDKNDNDTDEITPIWQGQSDKAPSDSPIYLQIYNRNSTTWEALDSDNTTAANTDFTLTGTQSTNLSNYYDANNWVVCRIYQEAI